MPVSRAHMQCQTETRCRSWPKLSSIALVCQCGKRPTGLQGVQIGDGSCHTLAQHCTQQSAPAACTQAGSLNVSSGFAPIYLELLSVCLEPAAASFVKSSQVAFNENVANAQTYKRK